MQARSSGSEKRPAGESGPNLENDTEERNAQERKPLSGPEGEIPEGEARGKDSEDSEEFRQSAA